MPEDLGQAELQARADRIEALGYVPSDGADLGVDEDVSPQELAERQKEANKQFAMPPEGQAAEKPVPPHSAEAASQPSEDSSGPTKEELMERAAELDIAGRSSMNKAELEAAIAEAEANQ